MYSPGYICILDEDGAESNVIRFCDSHEFMDARTKLIAQCPGKPRKVKWDTGTVELEEDFV